MRNEMKSVCEMIIWFIIVYLLTQYELSCNLIGSLDLYYQLILPFRSVMVHSQGSKSEVQSPKLVSKFPFNYVYMLSGYFLCCSNANVPTRLNVHVRSVIRKTVKLTKTALK